MIRSLATLVVAAAAYGFAIGAGNSWHYAWRSLVKFPLALLTTAAVCALSHFVLTRFVGAPLNFLTVQRTVLAIFKDVAVLLAGLSPAVFFLAKTMARPDAHGLGEYPLFQSLNVAAIGTSGMLAIAVRTHRLKGHPGLTGPRRYVLVASWMLVSLLVGGQVCWYMRPFFGIFGPASEPPFFTGMRPDYRGARSFYEALYFLVVPPPDE